MHRRDFLRVASVGAVGLLADAAEEARGIGMRGTTGASRPFDQLVVPYPSNTGIRRVLETVTFGLGGVYVRSGAAVALANGVEPPFAFVSVTGDHAAIVRARVLKYGPTWVDSANIDSSRVDRFGFDGFEVVIQHRPRPNDRHNSESPLRFAHDALAYDIAKSVLFAMDENYRIEPKSVQLITAYARPDMRSILGGIAESTSFAIPESNSFIRAKEELLNNVTPNPLSTVICLLDCGRALLASLGVQGLQQLLNRVAIRDAVSQELGYEVAGFSGDLSAISNHLSPRQRAYGLHCALMVGSKRSTGCSAPWNMLLAHAAEPICDVQGFSIATSLSYTM